MARDKRSGRPPRPSSGEEISKDTPVHPDVARFAARVMEQQAADRERKREGREARAREEQHQRLIADKDAAAGAVKRLRSREHVPPGEAAAAEAAYRQALATLISFETGAAPAWAGAAEPEAGPEPDAEDPPGPGPEPEAVAEGADAEEPPEEA